MRYVLLGRSGLRVSELCLGTMTFGQPGWGASREDSRRIFDAYVEAGGNFIDTANNYAGGTGERLVGELIAPDRDRFVVSTKFTAYLAPGDPNAGGNHRKHMVRALEASLKRIGTDYVDVFWVHTWDAMTPVEELVRGLDDLVRAGKVLYVGICNAPAWVVSRAVTVAEHRGWSPFVGLQVEYSLLERTAEHELIPMADALGLGILAWGALAEGLLTGKYAREGREDRSPRRLSGNDPRLNKRTDAIVAEVRGVARAIGASPAQVALAWLRQRPAAIVPLLGPRTRDQVTDAVGCLGLELPDEHRLRLDQASDVTPGTPHPSLDRMAHESARRGIALRHEP